MDWHLTAVLTVIFFGFIAPFIDSVVGGGRSISTPALLAIGLPPSLALGTNKFASSFNTLTSAFKFIRSGKVDLRIVLKIFPIVFIASGCGAILATYLPANVLKSLIIAVLSIVIVYTIVKKLGKYENFYFLYCYEGYYFYYDVYFIVVL
ncbi:membrane protein [Staphylococcus saccharolyticus]|uniref:Probable membrane transporter protein n=1 Tax=Staphylococcus saccharolyticus TaxID=33028 RepID=A0A380H260_9STAP|nr:membrane protein [Staphylococcus saccharolyticus]